jgi:hypothetical protein
MTSTDKLAWALTLVPLGARDRRAASLVCRTWRDAIDASWAYSGLAVRDNAVAELLMQPRWDALGRLTVYAPGDPRLRTAFAGLPRDMPALWHLHLRRVSLPCPAGGGGVWAEELGQLWASVLARAPRLRSVDLELQMYMTNYGLYLNHARALLAQGADQLESVALRGAGLVVYPMGVPAMETDAAFFAAQEARAWPAVCMPALKTYVNTGRQFASLAVNAYRLRIAEIEEPDAGEWIMERMVCPGLRDLTWSVPGPYGAAGAYPMFSGIVQRFQSLRALSMTFRRVRTPRDLGIALDSLTALPPGLERLDINMDVPYPHGWDWDWDRSPLAHLASLRDLAIRVSYATKSFETAFGLLGAPAGVERATVGARHSVFPQPDVDPETDPDDPGDTDDDSDDDDLKSWDVNPRVARLLTERPACHVTVEKLPVTLDVPRLTVLR